MTELSAHECYVGRVRRIVEIASTASADLLTQLTFAAAAHHDEECSSCWSYDQDACSASPLEQVERDFLGMPGVEQGPLRRLWKAIEAKRIVSDDDPSEGPCSCLSCADATMEDMAAEFGLPTRNPNADLVSEGA